MRNKKISIVIPVFNEVNNIDALLSRIYFSLDENIFPHEIIFIDDNSTDGTFEKIQNMIENKKKHQPFGDITEGQELNVRKFEASKANSSHEIKLYKKIGKKGKSYSLIEGFKKSTGDIIVMIDADLQYPPEAIPDMIGALKNSDIVVADRKNYDGGILRRVLSRGFRFVFGKLLFGLNHDVQSGLKAMRRKVVELINFTPDSAWTFDLEFLHRAKQVGFTIENKDIVFSKRENDISKINFIKTTFEIGLNALAVRAKRIHPIAIPSQSPESMLGAGIMHKRKRLITHTTLHHSQSAISTFIPWQVAFIAFIVAIAVLGLILNYTAAIITVVAILSGIYFIDVVFNLFVILKSLYLPPELKFEASEIKNLISEFLPVYSILCPLFREAKVLPGFIDSIEKLNWPKEKLDVLLLLEEDDEETISTAASLNLPFYVRTIIVPNSEPKTKPKACNFGLSKAIGEYLVIFDAEDRPEPDQLKKAYLGFKKTDENVVCLQAKLNYFNPHQNLLTRLFTAEYSLWFDVMLTGLQSINTTIPLGGTSNHFKINAIKNLEGWDPFNVTEDCDLGVRIFKKGLKTAIIDSTTWEEANSNVANWLRQRSRWIKGYLQTYLVHNRNPIQFVKKHGWHAFIFQLIIGARMAFMLINPILWLLTFSYFTLYSLVGPTIESFYPSIVLYMAVISLIAGNFMYVYDYMIGCAKRGQWNLIKFIYLIPFYWLMASVSATIAIYQLIIKPHYWEKTIHGLHLDKEKIKYIAEEAVIKAEWKVEKNLPFFGFPEWIKVKFQKIGNFRNKKELYLGGVALVLLTMTANVFNFVFSIYLGRSLPLESFGELSLFTSLLYFVSIPLGNFSGTISHNIAYLYGKYSKDYARGYLKYIFNKSVILGAILTMFWFALTPFISHFFHTKSFTPILIFAPLLIISVISSNYSGFMAGTLSFGKKGLVLATEAITRLLFALVLVGLGFSNLVFLSILFSISISTLLSWQLTRSKHVEEIKAENKQFNMMFFLTSTLNGLSLIAFLTLDVILVKHFLSPADAGRYGLLALIGKMTYFFGSLFGPFMVPLISHNEGANKDSKKTFIFLFAITFIFSALSFTGLGLFGGFFVPLIFGSKTLSIIPLLLPYVLAMAVFTTTQPIISFFQAKKNYSFAIVGFLISIFQIISMSLFHRDLQQIVFVMLSTSIANLAFMSILYLVRNKLGIVYSNLKDLYGLFVSAKKETASDIKAVRILIFNWRDTQHKWAGGAEVYVHELAKRWVKDGNFVTVFCGNGTKRPRTEKIDGVEIIRRGGFYTVYLWAALYYIFKFKGKYDVIIDCENGIPFFTPLYSRKPIFLLIHHVHQEVFRKSLIRPLATFASFLEIKLMPLIYRNIQVITVSPSSKEEILKHKLTKTDPIIIYNGVDLAKFVPGRKNIKPLIVYLGRLQFYKSLHVFIKAAKYVLESAPNTEFIIAGEGEQKGKLIKLAEKLNISEKIKFAGKVSEEEKIMLFQKAWVFVNPSFMEGWGITTLEANACGTPAVASDVPGLRDSIRDPFTGILVAYGKHEIFAENILKLIKDKRLRNTLSKEAIKWANNFTWENSARDLYSIVSEKVREGKEKVPARSAFSYLVSRITSLF
jgi:cellulose synthase/poly-beta-1,6-N-acetylglucosamine synthase-like glycosyltransferase/glycosyltransferase involved in cell wall biosynthesis/O-antigen/teichoic acid export membrane protein